MRQQGQVEVGGGGVQSRLDPAMHLAVVACGDRLEETLTMIKSAVLFSIKHIYLHIFAEDQLHASFMEAVSWKYLKVYFSLHVDHILFCVFVHAIQYLICVPVGIVAWFHSLQVQLHSLLHQLPQ